MTEAQKAIREYYKAVIALEEAGVISEYHGDELSSDMVSAVGNWEEYPR